MKNKTWKYVLISFFTFVVAGCAATQTAPRDDEQLVDAACLVTQSSYNHIYARHCSGGGGGSQLLTAYCTQTGMQQFCGMVQNSPNKYRVVQGDGRIRYDANLAMVVGTQGEKCGRLVIEPNGNVVTEFPELSNAPGVCQ